jgi:hypothetical protein
MIKYMKMVFRTGLRSSNEIPCKAVVKESLPMIFLPSGIISILMINPILVSSIDEFISFHWQGKVVVWQLYSLPFISSTPTN